MATVAFPEDCQRIVDVLDTVGITLSLDEAERMWEQVSGAAWASWLKLPEDQLVIKWLVGGVAKEARNHYNSVWW